MVFPISLIDGNFLDWNFPWFPLMPCSKLLTVKKCMYWAVFSIRVYNELPQFSASFLFCASSRQYIKIFKWSFLPYFCLWFQSCHYLGTKRFWNRNGSGPVLSKDGTKSYLCFGFFVFISDYFEEIMMSLRGRH